MSGRRTANAILAALLAAAVVLIAVELAVGALDFGEAKLADPCTAKPHVRESGFFHEIDAAVQRFGLSTLNGAACSLHTTREELVLSFVPEAGTKRITWDKPTIEQALRAGMRKAAHDVAGNGIGGNLLAFVLDNAIARPIAFFLGEISS